jgi:hypothetical protein
MAIDAPAEEEVRRSPVAMAPEEVGGVIIVDHQAIALGPGQKRADESENPWASSIK